MTAVTQTDAFQKLDESILKDFILKASQWGAFKYWIIFIMFNADNDCRCCVFNVIKNIYPNDRYNKTFGDKNVT